MPWFNADDKLHSHPKTRQAGLEAMGLWVVAGTYCSQYLTEGVVPGWLIESWPKGRRIAQKLIDARLWEATGSDYLFLSWDEYQRTKEQVEDDRAKWRERQRKHRERKQQQGDTHGDNQSDTG